MKNRKKYILIVAVLFICCSILKAQSYYNSEFTVSLGAGSSALKYQVDNEYSKSGFGWQLGTGYSYYFNRMIGVSLGVEAAMFGSSVEMKNISFEQQIQTPPGLSGRFTLKANYDGFKEKQNLLLLQIPVMLQFQFPVSENNSVFFGTGIKAGFLPISSKWNQNITKLTTTGYSEYTGQTYIDMPNHGFSTFPNKNTSGEFELKNPVYLAVEGGLKFGVGEGKYLYTGVFLDYGLNDIYKKSAGKSLLEYNNASPADYIHNSVLSANQFSVSNGIKPFTVGIKFKIGFGVGSKKAPKPEPIWGWE